MLPDLQKIGLLAISFGLLVSSAGHAEAADKSGQLVVNDKGSFFSDSGITRAKEEFARLQSKTGRQAMVVTLKELPAVDAQSYAKIDQKDKPALRKFWYDLAVSMAKTDQAHGVYILICRKPGHVEVVADREMREKGFDKAKERQLGEDFAKALHEAAKEKAEADQVAAQDRALMSAVEYLEKNLPATSADVKQSTKPSTKPGGRQVNESGGWGIGQWVCLGIAVLGGVWVLFAIIRAMSGGGGMAGPGGGGFGGGGFLSSMLGGLFGAAAGMWIYDQFLGGRSSRGGDYYGGNADYGDTGAATDAGAS